MVAESVYWTKTNVLDLACILNLRPRERDASTYSLHNTYFKRVEISYSSSKPSTSSHIEQLGKNRFSVDNHRILISRASKIIPTFENTTIVTVKTKCTCT